MEQSRVQTSFMHRSAYVNKRDLFDAILGNNDRFSQPTSDLNYEYQKLRNLLNNDDGYLRKLDLFKHDYVNFYYFVLMSLEMYNDDSLISDEKFKNICSLLTGKMYNDDKLQKPIDNLLDTVERISFAKTYKLVSSKTGKDVHVIGFSKGPMICACDAKIKGTLSALKDYLVKNDIHDFYLSEHRGMWTAIKMPTTTMTEIEGVKLTQKECFVISSMVRSVLDYIKWSNKAGETRAKCCVIFMSYMDKPIPAVRSALNSQLHDLKYLVDFIMRSTFRVEMQNQAGRPIKRMCFSHQADLYKVDSLKELLEYAKKHNDNVCFNTLNEYIYEPNTKMSSDAKKPNTTNLKAIVSKVQKKESSVLGSGYNADARERNPSGVKDVPSTSQTANVTETRSKPRMKPGSKSFRSNASRASTS